MKLIKRIGLAILIVLIAIQFIRPARNKTGQESPADITKVYSVPAKVHLALQSACYDCHSNNTEYPWYANIQPLAWWLANHIKHGKKELNFNEFGTYSDRRQLSKLKGIAHSIEDGTMPLRSYRFIHKSANLSEKEKELILNWIEEAKDGLSEN